MATIAEVRLRADEFALSSTLDTVDEVRFEIERIVAHDPAHIMPYVWVTTHEWDAFDYAIADDPSVDMAEKMAHPTDTEALYQMDWTDSIEPLVQIIVEEEGGILVAEGNHDGWLLRVLFPDRDALSRTYTFCKEHGLSLDILRLYDVDQGKGGEFGLTAAQEETIAVAYNCGYYDVPRESTLTETAEEIGISHQALSERLRRGHKTLVENSVIISHGVDAETTPAP